MVQSNGNLSGMLRTIPVDPTNCLRTTADHPLPIELQDGNRGTASYDVPARLGNEDPHENLQGDASGL